MAKCGNVSLSFFITSLKNMTRVTVTEHDPMFHLCISLWKVQHSAEYIQCAYDSSLKDLKAKVGRDIALS